MHIAFIRHGLWPFLKTLDRVEVPLHSIHYIDWIRSVLGNPKSLYCQSVKHPKVSELADCRTSAIFNYGDNKMLHDNKSLPLFWKKKPRCIH